MDKEFNKSKTFSTFDKLDRKEFAGRLTNSIISESTLYDDSYVLSLDGDYGSGKTTFIEMWQSDLKDKGHYAITINAWETDFAEDPLLPIIEGLMQISDSDTESALYDAAYLGLSIAFQLFQNVIKVDVNQAVEDLNQTKNSDSGKAIIEAFKKKKDTLLLLKQSLAQFIAKDHSKKLFIFVDELDRTRPNYAIRFLETIKHFFSVKGLIFVLAINKKQLFNSMRQMYGKDLDAKGYYRRFILREVSLQKLLENGNEAFVESILDNIAKDTDFHKDFHIKYICKIFYIFNLSLRDCEYCLRGFSQVLKENSKLQGYLQLSIFLLALSIKDEEFYNILKQDGFDTLRLIDELEALFKKYIEEPQPHIIGLIAMGNVTNTDLQRVIQFINEHGDKLNPNHEPSFIEDVCNNMMQNMSSRIYGQSFPINISPINKVIEKVEHWRDIFEK